MARISDHELEQLKASVSLQRLVEARGVQLKRHGADLHGCCPFHDDKTPSLVVSPAKNLWHCLGACATGGTVIDWAMRAEGVSFRHAVELLRNDALAASSLAATPAVQRSTVRKLAAPVQADATDAELLAQLVDYYQQTLRTSPEALAYLEKRGIASDAAIDVFKLGYANRTLGLRLPAMNRKSGTEVRTRLQRLGVLRESGHEHLNGSLVVPLFHADGTVADLYGRKINDNLRAGTPVHLYLPRPHAGVWNRDCLASPEIILCESLIDALTFWVAGYRNVTTSYGTNGFTDELLAALKEAGTQRVLIAYDRDAAGDTAADALAKTLMAESMDAYRVKFPKGMDANEYALSVQPAAQSLGLAIRKAEWLGNGKAPVREAITPVQEAPTASSLAAAVAVEAKPAAKEKMRTEHEDGSRAAAALTSAAAAQAEVLPAYRVAPAAPDAPAAELDGDALMLTLEDRCYTVRGIEKNTSYEQLKVWMRVVRGAFTHIDTVELYQARARAVWIKQACVELGVSEELAKTDLAALLRCVEQRQDALLRERLQPAQTTTATTLSAEDEAAGLALLRDPSLCERIVADVGSLGVVGEDDNALLGYLAAVSRKLDKPLAVLIQSTSAAGKSTLMDALLSLMPEHERVQYSAMTGQSLFYLGEGDLKHKILAIAEEEGVRQAAYALKLLQSQGELTMASTGKDPVTGKLVTEEYRVEGPVMLMLTTTAIDIDEELLNRCLVLTINESREQTQAIHARQRQARTLEGLLTAKTGAHVRAAHQAAQALLRSLAVVNPYAEQLTFRSERTRTRRDHAKYLTLIDAIALLHQQQRPVKTVEVAGQRIEYIEVQPSDIALANRLAATALGRSLDELPPQTRRVLGVVVDLVHTRMAALVCTRAAVRFTRKEVREVAGVTDTALRLHMERLVELEYLLVHRGMQGTRFVYELAFDGEVASDAPQLVGLRDVEASTTDNFAPLGAEFAPLNGHFAPRSHPENTPFTPTSQGLEIAEIGIKTAPSSLVAAVAAENALLKTGERLRGRKHNGHVVQANA